MCDIDIDISQHRPLRLGVVLSDRVLWDSEPPAERLRGVELSDVARKSARHRRHTPDVDVVVDIDVVIAGEARTARAILDVQTDEIGTDTLLYVGTPVGLAGLLGDIHALGIVDGAILIPRAAGVAELIRGAVLPSLDTGLQLPSETVEGRSA